MLLALAMLLSYIESLLPLTLWFPIPGCKLGLPNVLITAVFLEISPRDAAGISLCRILLMGLLFGNAVSLLFSLCGGALAYLGLWLLARCGRHRFSLIGISIGCAALHNIGQMLVAALLFGGGVLFTYLPLLLLASLLFGGVSGALLRLLLPRLAHLRRSFCKGDSL